MKTQRIDKGRGAFLSVQRAKDSVSIVRFGHTLRDDPSAKYRLVGVDPESGKVADVAEGPIPRKGILKLELEGLQNYVIVAAGEKTAGLISSAELNLQAPFYLSMDAPAVDWKAVRDAEKVAEKQSEAKAQMRRSPLATAIKRTLH